MTAWLAAASQSFLQHRGQAIAGHGDAAAGHIASVFAIAAGQHRRFFGGNGATLDAAIVDQRQPAVEVGEFDGRLQPLLGPGAWPSRLLQGALWWADENPRGFCDFGLVRF